MSRTQLLLPFMCLVLMGLGVAFWGRHPLGPPTPTPARPSLPIPKPDTISTTNIGHEDIVSAVPSSDVAAPIAKRTQAASVPEAAIPAQTELTGSSWENPFSPANWKAVGWTFSQEGMRTISEDATTATFLRPYQKLMFECDILAQSPEKGSWELRLATEKPSVIMSLMIHDGKISVMAIEKGHSRLILEKPLTVPLSVTEPRQFRMVATGNRIVINWNRRHFLSTEQLATQSGQQMTWSIHTENAVFEIPQLRVEGD